MLRKRLLPLLLVVASVLVTNFTMFAGTKTPTSCTINNKTYTINTTEENGTKIVNVKGNGEDSTVTLNKVTKKVSIREANRLLVPSNTIQKEEDNILQTTKDFNTYAQQIDSGDTLYYKYKYAVFRKDSGAHYWMITDGYSTKWVDEITSNESHLWGFRSSVKTCAWNMRKAKSILGDAGLAAVVGFLSAPESVGLGALIGLLVALGYSTVAAGYLYDAREAAIDARLHYDYV